MQVDVVYLFLQIYIMTTISNLIQPIVAGYFYTDVYNNHNPDSKVVKGGFPVDSLIDMTSDDFIMRGGGNSTNNSNSISRETLKKQFSNYGVPIGLVYIEESCNFPSNNNEYEVYDNIPLATAVDEKTYDTLVDLISYPLSGSTKTPRIRSHSSKKHTKKINNK